MPKSLSDHEWSIMCRRCHTHLCGHHDVWVALLSTHLIIELSYNTSYIGLPKLSHSDLYFVNASHFLKNKGTALSTVLTPFPKPELKIILPDKHHLPAYWARYGKIMACANARNFKEREDLLDMTCKEKGALSIGRSKLN